MSLRQIATTASLFGASQTTQKLKDILGRASASGFDEFCHHSNSCFDCDAPRSSGMWPKRDQPCMEVRGSCHDRPGNQKNNIIAPVKNSFPVPLAGVRISPSFRLFPV